jgi:galactose mutarotase-like enzyme
VHGGVPFLFPAAGRLKGDRYRDREMKQHGFARNRPFAVERRDRRSAILSLRSSDETRARFPLKRDLPFSGFDFSRPEVDLHLHDHGGSWSALRRPGAPAVEIEASAEFTHWVVWALGGKDFICVEPWTAPGNALNTGERLLFIEPGAERNLWLAIRVA